MLNIYLRTFHRPLTGREWDARQEPVAAPLPDTSPVPATDGADDTGRTDEDRR